MKNLRHHDWQILVSAIEKLHSDFDAQTLPERALSAASRIISADSVVFTGISYSSEYSGIAWDNSESLSPEDMKIFAAYLHEHPLFTAFNIERRIETLKITDLVSRQEFHQTNIYNELYRRIKIANQLITPLSITDDLFIACSINTSKADFSGRDRSALTLLAPHLANAIRNAFAYKRLSSALETEACGVIAINSEGAPVFVSEFAGQLFERYFAGEKREANSLPESLWKWTQAVTSEVKTAECKLPPKPLRIENQSGALTVRWMHNSTTRERTLLLEEKRFLSPQSFEQLNLTRREAEILLLIAQGKTDDAIATLCRISPRTVHKHVEHIYTKLGVETRTAAMLKALGTL